MTTKGLRLTKLQKASDHELLEAYYELGSVWRVAERFDMCGQSVQERLVKLGIKNRNAWSEEEVMFLAGFYAMAPGNTPISLDEVTEKINEVFGTRRLKSNVCRKARELNLGTEQKRKSTLEVKVKNSISKRLVNSRGGNSISGMREDIGIFVRSSWEANYARYLNLMIANGSIEDWEYEKTRFGFDGVKRGPYFYIPDFKIIFKDGSHEWHEVKGYMDSKGRSKIKRMAKFYPDEKVVVIDKTVYGPITVEFAHKIPTWEYPTKRTK